MELLEDDVGENLGDLRRDHGLARRPPTIWHSSHAPWSPPKGVAVGRPPKTRTRALTPALFLTAKTGGRRGGLQHMHGSHARVRPDGGASSAHAWPTCQGPPGQRGVVRR